MKKTIIAAGLVAVLVAVSVPASAQGLGGLTGALKKAEEGKKKFDELNITDAEEQQLGKEISAKLRDKYGVVQDAAVHKYVTLVGALLATSSSRPNLGWTFIVLDTDGVNAFAAPGGYIHITRGALAILDNEAELADVLAHELSHVTGKHTVHAIQKATMVKEGTDRAGALKAWAEKGFEITLENKFDRGQEEDADKDGAMLANKAGYSPNGLSAFLTRLADRNKGLKERSGIFASHPETQARLDALKKVIASNKLTATAMVAARFHQAISYKPAEIAGVVGSGQVRTGGGSGLGLSGLAGLGKEKSSNQTVASAGARGVNPDRDAKGGPNKSLVVVTVTAAEIAQFRKGIVG